MNDELSDLYEDSLVVGGFNSAGLGNIIVEAFNTHAGTHAFTLTFVRGKCKPQKFCIDGFDAKKLVAFMTLHN